MPRFHLVLVASAVCSGIAIAEEPPLRAKAIAAIESNDFGRAIKLFSLALEANPNDSDNYACRGYALACLGKYDAAIGDLSRAIELCPTVPANYVNRAGMYLKCKEYDRAILDCNMCLHYDSENFTAYLNRGLAYTEKGDFTKALTNYDMALKIEPKSEHALCNRGIALSLKKDYTAAIRDFDAAIEQCPTLSSAYLNRGLAKSQSGQQREAMADLKRAVDCDGANSGATYQLAYHYLYSADPELRDTAAALDLMKGVCERLGRPEAAYLVLLAAAYAHNGQFDDAVRVQCRACDLLSMRKDKELVNATRVLESYRNKKIPGGD